MAKRRLITYHSLSLKKRHEGETAVTAFSLFGKVIVSHVLYISENTCPWLNKPVHVVWLGKAICLWDVQINDQLKSSSVWSCFISAAEQLYWYVSMHMKYMSACWLEEILRSIWLHISLLTFRELWYANGTPCMCHLCNVFCYVCAPVN